MLIRFSRLLVTHCEWLFILQKSEVADINWTEQEIDRLKALVSEGKTNKEIASMLSSEYGREFSKISVKSKRQRLKEAKPPRVNRSQTEIKSDGTQTHQIKVRMTEEQSKNPDYVLQAHGYSPDSWELIQATNNIWEQNNREDGLIQLYQSKIVVRPRVAEFNASAFTESIEPVKLTSIKTGDRNLFIGLADWHFGITKLGDLQDKLAMIVDVVSKGYKQIVIGQLGDLFHSSQIKKSVTMAGTVLDDVDMETAIKDARSFFDVLITECARHSLKVTVEHAEGNHSGSIEYMFLLYLEVKYPDIKVNYHNKYRQAFMLDNVAIMITHGQYGKRKDLPMLFATEFSDMWSKATTREIITGHFHTQQTNDYQGVIHRQLGTIKPNDSYEIENGWTMGKKVLQLFEYDSERLRVTYDI